MHTLQEKLYHSNRFLIGSELVSVRGSMAERSAVKVRDFASELTTCPHIDWISITDNAGGNPQMAPQALGKPILYAGKEVIIHLTCKDLNRNGLESEAWSLHSEGFHNILAMTGDYPITGNGGIAKPVFDIDSVGLIALLRQMNEGIVPHTAGARARTRLAPTSFLVGAVTTNYKRLPGELMPQYLKLERKVRSGAAFIINQVGYDARRMHELRIYMDQHGMKDVPLIGNVYVLNGAVARLFHEGRIPGVVVSTALLELCQRQAASPDRGGAFFRELAAKQIAIYQGLGYRGAYIGGVYDFASIEEILAIARTYGADDWREFARELRFGRSGEYFAYAEDRATGLADAARPVPPPAPSRSAGISYQLSRLTHDTMFAPGRLQSWAAAACRRSEDPAQGPRLLRWIEHASKSALFACHDCGDCSLPETAYLCPESQCAKNQRNGPCGGTRDGRCEVDGYGDCIWVRAYDRLAAAGRRETLLAYPTVVQDHGLRGSSAWANHWLGRDHGTRNDLPKP